MPQTDSTMTSLLVFQRRQDDLFIAPELYPATKPLYGYINFFLTFNVVLASVNLPLSSENVLFKNTIE